MGRCWLKLPNIIYGILQSTDFLHSKQKVGQSRSKLVALGHWAKLVTNGQVTNYQLCMQLVTWAMCLSPGICKECVALSIYNCPWVNLISLSIWVKLRSVWVLWCILLGYVMHEWTGDICTIVLISVYRPIKLATYFKSNDLLWPIFLYSSSQWGSETMSHQMFHASRQFYDVTFSQICCGNIANLCF